MKNIIVYCLLTTIILSITILFWILPDPIPLSEIIVPVLGIISMVKKVNHDKQESLEDKSK